MDPSSEEPGASSSSSSSTSSNNANKPREQRSPGQDLWNAIPSIKILQPPKGIHSTNTDERCITYCSQTVAGRNFRRDPWCRSICIRKVFSHEVRNILSIKTHSNTTPDGRTKYPLPAEGQRLPSWSIGNSEEDEKPVHQKKVWEEGLYVWVSKSRFGANEKLDLMTMDLERQAKWEMIKEQRKKDWAEWEAKEEKAKWLGKASSSAQGSESANTDSQSDRLLNSHQPSTGTIITPPLRRPFPHKPEDSLLLPLPPPNPFAPLPGQIQALLAPTHKVLGIFHESITSGEQWTMAGKVWEKAWTNEPFKLAGVVCSRMWEKWKEGPPDEEDEKPKNGP